MMKQTNKNFWKKFFRLTITVLCCLLLLIAFLAFFSAKWYVETYGQLGFDSILFTLFSDLNGVESDLVNQYLKAALVPALVYSLLFNVFLFLSFKKKLILKILPKFRMTLYPIHRVVAILCSIVFSMVLIFNAAYKTQLIDYIYYISSNSTIFQDEYVSPKNTNITFPEKKRNLIYIFLESMENTFFSKEQGGALDAGAIDELYDLAADNVNFSCNDSVGGLRAANGSTWTIAAMVSHTSGVPLKMPPGIGMNDYGQEDVFLPGVKTITDVLHENGYYQTLMVGSESVFGGRRTYFNNHNVDYIYDYHTAVSEGMVPPDYYVWWGIEDYRLYNRAQQELTEISKKEEPFALYMLTVDTHFTNGYVCEYCDNNYERQYDNVLSCGSKQLYNFLQWLKTQDFYEDTTVVIVGDHPTMDEEYIKTVGASDFPRCVYNCFVNSAVQPSKTRNRTAYTLDLFPTTLAAMGCSIEGERLGLGTNLFSDTPTLAETMGGEVFNEELSKNSSYYTKEFFFVND